MKRVSREMAAVNKLYYSVCVTVDFLQSSQTRLGLDFN